MTQSPLPVKEATVIYLLMAIQIVNTLDYVMVMPLGPDFALALGIQPSHLGYIGASYTLAAAITGFISYWFLDRFDRKKALLWSGFGLSLGTFLGALSQDFWSLLGSRIFTGCFGGPLSALVFAVVSDIVPLGRRGRAMSLIMTAFSLTSVFGIPVGLKMAEWGGWHAPFYLIGAISSLTFLLVWLLLPALTIHLESGLKPRPLALFLNNKTVLLSFGLAFTLVFSAFLMIPYLATYVQFNLGFPRSDLGNLYLVGGIFNLAVARPVGLWTDKRGPLFTISIGTILYLATLSWGFGELIPSPSAMLIYIFFMVSMCFRMVSMQTQLSRVARPEERGAYMSLSNAIRHGAAGFAGIVSSWILTVGPGGSLVHMPTLAALAAASGLACPFLAKILEAQLRQLEQSASQTSGPSHGKAA